MRFGIVVNLDYASYPHALLSTLFRRIRTAMEANGFRLDGRIFTIRLPASEAAALARSTLEELDKGLEIDGSIYDYLKEFYGFDIGSVKNLLLPEMQALEVEELDPMVIIEEIHLASN